MGFRWQRTVDGSLTGQLFQHFGGTSETITRFTDGDVQDEFVDTQLAHGIGALVVAFRHLDRYLDGGVNDCDRVCLIPSARLCREREGIEVMVVLGRISLSVGARALALRQELNSN